METKKVIQLLNDASYWIEAVSGAEKDEQSIKDMLKAIETAIELINKKNNN